MCCRSRARGGSGGERQQTSVASRTLEPFAELIGRPGRDRRGTDTGWLTETGPGGMSTTALSPRVER